MVDYSDTTIRDIYNSIVMPQIERGLAWVIAENTYAVRAIIIKWFKALESGSAFKKHPNLLDNSISMEKANKLVEELDAEFDVEFENRKESIGADASADFRRLPPYARLAFAQELFKVLKTEEQLEKELKKRLENGEVIPPKEKVNQYFNHSTTNYDWYA